jgi:hypothetical protein
LVAVNVLVTESKRNYILAIDPFQEVFQGPKGPKLKISSKGRFETFTKLITLLAYN